MMDSIKEIILNLTELEKQELYDYLKLVINEEFENSELNICECPNCGSQQILKNGKYNRLQRYICKKCLITFTSKTKTIFSTTKL